LLIKSLIKQYEDAKGTFLVPNYYKNFNCKTVHCRDSCCVDWLVTITMDQYFLLHGLDVEKELKNKIDRTFRPFEKPTPLRYAEIVHKLDGDCPLHKSDGFCLLHERCDEAALPMVCRTYPRAIKTNYIYEVSCANSCEKTLELLFENNDPIQFEDMILRFKVYKQETTISSVEKVNYRKVRDIIFSNLANRNFSFKDRIVHVGKLLQKLDLDETANIENLEFKTEDYQLDFDENYGYFMELTDWFIENNKRLAPYLNRIKDLHRGKNFYEIYISNKNHFENLFDNHEIFFEKLLINDLFYRQFPFQNYTNSFYDEFIAIVGTYSFLRFISINLMENKNSLDEYIDILSSFFTVISHSSFDKNIMILFKKMGLVTKDKLGQILQF